MPGPVIAAKLLADVSGFTRGMQSAGQSLQAVGNQMLGVSKKAFALSAAIAAVGGIAVSQFAQFEKRMALVGVISGATELQFARLEASAAALGATTLFTARQAAEGMEILAKAGFDVNKILAATPEVLNLATAANIELAEATDIVVGIMSGYGKTADEVGKANDVLVKTFTSTNVTVGDLGETFKLVGPVAKTAGIEFEELSAAIGILGNAGIKGSLAGTALRKAIISFSAPTPRAMREMKRLGLEVLDANGNMKPLADILDVLATERGPALIKALKDIIGIRPAAALAKLTESGGAALRNLTEDLRRSGGTAKKLAETQINTLSGQFTILKSKIEAVSIAMGKRLAPLMRDIVKRAQKFVDALLALDDNTKNTVLRIAAFTAGISALVGIFAAVAGAATLLAGAVLLLAAPIAILALFIALGGAMKIAWEKNLGGVKDAFADLKKFFEETIAGLKNLFGQFFDDVGKSVKKFSDFFQKPIAIEIPIEVLEKGDQAGLDLVKALVTQGFRGKALTAQLKSILQLDPSRLDVTVKTMIKPFSDLTDAILVLEKARPDLFGGDGAAKDFATGFAAVLKDTLEPGAIKEALKKSFVAGLEGLKDLIPPDVLVKLKALKDELVGMVGKIGQGAKELDADLLALLSQGRLVTDRISLLGDETNSFIDILKDMGEVFSDIGRTIKNVAGPQIKSAITGLAGDVLKGAIQGAEAGGPVGAAVGALTALILASKTFKDIISLVNRQLQFAADLIGALLEPLRPLIAMMFMFTRALITASPLFILLGIAMNALTPVFKILFEIMKFLGIVILKVARFFLKLIGRSTRKVDKQLKELEETSFDTAGNIEDLGDAANAAAEALFNVPQGFKVAAARFREQEGETRGGGGDGGGGPGGGGPRAPGRILPFEAPIVGQEGPEGPIGTAEGAATEGREINVFVTTDDPEELADRLVEIMDRRGVARRGIPNTRTAGQFSTKRGSS